ncbi:MAG: hypothetical protein RIT19_2561 [Verrucomicrobiota bacterium]|jgi:hypothetical protein
MTHSSIPAAFDPPSVDRPILPRGAVWRCLVLLAFLANPASADPSAAVSGKNRTFRAGLTYLVDGPVRLEGNIRFEAGCVVKFLPGRSAGLELVKGCRVSWQATPDAPIVFTASDDDSVGEPVPGSKGRPAPGPYAEVALSVDGARPESGSLRWNDLRISHARVALRWTGTTAALWHFQVQDCEVGIEATDSALALRNGLFHRVGAPFHRLRASRVNGQQLTIARSGTLNRSPENSTLELLRCILGEVGDSGGFTHPSPEGNPNAVIPPTVSDAFVEAAGSLYLPPGSRRVRPGFGHDLLDPELAAVLPTMTVLPPEPLPALVTRNLRLTPRAIRDRALPEAGGLNPIKLGFHHWPIDHWAEGTTVSNAVVSVAPDTVLREAPGRGFRWIGSGSLRRESRVEPDTSAAPKARPTPGRGDRDGDGRTDLDEHFDGTDPDDPSSIRPRILASFGFDTDRFESDGGVPPLPGSSASREPSFDRTAAGFHRPGQVLRYPLVWNRDGAPRTPLLSRHGSLSLDYSPDWFHGSTQDAPGVDCVLLEAPGLRVTIDAAGRKLSLTRISDAFEQTLWSPLPRSTIHDHPFQGRTNWTLRFSFSEETFDRLPRESHSRPPGPDEGRNTFSVGNALDGQSPALGRIDRVVVRNHLLPGGIGHPDPRPGVIRPGHRPLEADDKERISGESLASVLRLTFPRDWEGDGDQGAPYPIARRTLGPAPTDWEIIERQARTSVFDDPTARPGRTYGYRILRNGRPPLEVCVAHDSPPPEDRGRVLLLVDETLADRLAKSLERHRADLIADGWEVVQHPVPRHIDADPQDFDCRRYDAEALPRNRADLLAIKGLLRREYETHPGRTHVAVLIGHPTIPQSGWAAEDGHVACQDPAGIHLGAWPADLFYGDLTGTWTDTRSFKTDCPDCPRSQCTYCILGNEAGDGRWDQNELPREPDGSPGRIEVPIGRIDFARLSHFDSRFAGLPGSPRNAKEVEIALLERYLDKAWRYRRGLIPFRDSAIGYANVLGPLVDRNLMHILPRLAPAETPTPETWNSDLFQQGPNIRWGFQTDYSHFGVLGMTGAAKPGHSHFAKNVAWKRPGDVPRVAFLFAFGSFLGQWYSGYGEDFLRTCLASDDAVLVAGTAYAFTPWITDRVHAGAPIHALLTDSAEANTRVNARLTFLLGDPCLLEHPLRAPSDFQAKASGNGTELTWTASPEADRGYRIDAAPRDDAIHWTLVQDLPPGTTRFRTEAVSAGKIFRLRGLGTVTNGSGRHQQWTAPCFVAP